jgi:hypothetical protein
LAVSNWAVQLLPARIVCSFSSHQLSDTQFIQFSTRHQYLLSTIPATFVLWLGMSNITLCRGNTPSKANCFIHQLRIHYIRQFSDTQFVRIYRKERCVSTVVLGLVC